MKKKILCIVTALTILASSLATSVSAAAAPTTPQNLLILGDSIAAGTGLSDASQSFGSQLAAKFGLTGSHYVNLAQDGTTSSDLLASLQTQDTQNAVKAADTIVISVGGDDILGPFLTIVKTAIGQPTLTDAQLYAFLADPSNVEAAFSKLDTFLANSDDSTFDSLTNAAIAFPDNLAKIITAIKAANSQAKIYFMTVYDPFGVVSDSDLDSASSGDSDNQLLQYLPFEILFEGIFGGDDGLNSAITSGAKQNGVSLYTPVDVYTAFDGKALTYTGISNMNIHPNTAGHTAIYNLLYTAMTSSSNKYTVSFNSNGGNQVASQSITSGSTAAKPSAPARSGYKFDGWFTSSSLATAYDFSKPVTGSITLYAKWTAVSTGTGTSSKTGSNSSSKSSNKSANPNTGTEESPLRVAIAGSILLLAAAALTTRKLRRA